MPGFIKNNLGVLTVILCVVVGFIICVTIIAVQRKHILEQDRAMTEIRLQSEKEIAEIRKEAEVAKKEARIEIEGMPAGAVAIKFLSDDDILARANIVDGIARDIIIHQLKFFGEMGIELVTVHPEGVR